jgi:hypothetical protein
MDMPAETGVRCPAIVFRAVMPCGGCTVPSGEPAADTVP